MKIARTHGCALSVTCKLPIKLLKVTVSRIVRVDPARPICRKRLDRDGLRHFRAFVANDMHVVSSGVNEAHTCGVDVRFAVWIVPIVGRNSSSSDDKRLRPGVEVLAGTETLVTSITPKRPKASVVPTKPSAGVACTFFARKSAVMTVAALNKTNHDNLRRILTSPVPKLGTVATISQGCAPSQTVISRTPH